MNRNTAYHFFIAVFVVLISQALFAQKQTRPVPPLYFDKGKLIYTPDSLNNRIPDFSFCGYMASAMPMPVVPVKVTVPVRSGDATSRIQAAIDYVSGLPLAAHGFRGAVLLSAGRHEVLGQLKIKASGVVLRGCGSGAGGTQLIGAGTSRETLIRVAGNNDRQVNSSQKVVDAYVPVNAVSFSVENAAAFKVGDHIVIHRPSTAAWIKTLGTDHFGGGITALGWKPGDRDLYFDRAITSVHGNRITIDAPITTALDTSFGGAFVAAYHWEGRIQHIGVENLQLISAYNKKNAKDEDHRWDAIGFENVTNGWVRQVRFQHFAGSAVRLLESSKQITVEDCISLEPVSEIGGQRRYTFFTSGQQNLFQRCYAEDGYHDFAVGYCAPGPNAFVQCESVLAHSFSGAIDSWASGVLMDVVNVDGNALRFGNRGQDANGAGWAAANSVFWNCSAARMDCYKPPTAQNWAFGSWSQFSGDGYWNESNNSISPRSLFYAQLQERLNRNIDEQAQLLDVPTEASSSPSVETAMALTKEAAMPRMQLKEWIEQASKRHEISADAGTAKSIDAIGLAKPAIARQAPPMEIRNGVLARGQAVLHGNRISVQWWSGGLQPKDISSARPHITRFVPGRTGKGLTDDLGEVATDMKATNTIAIEHNYGLWYDRRRDDHERIRRMDGEVWPPFYELPFARSGKETAWDGLSKYDLNQFNHFYWSRLKQFADLADQHGLLLVQQHYFQHNIIEAGAHYADFPWRTANNVNHTGFAEPVNYAGDKRIFYAAQFYDLSNPVRKALHRQYIRKCLDNFVGNNGVVHMISEEYTGPVHFVKFWLDVIREWKKETGSQPLIALSTTKDVQDSVLAMPEYASLINIIDIRYWHYQADGSVYAPKGGQNLAPRQHARLLKPKKTSFEQVYRAVKEYRSKFPAKAVIYSGDNYPEFGMAVLMAGGSLPVLPAGVDQALVNATIGLKPVDAANKDEYVLSDGKVTIVYNSQTRRLEKR